MQGGPGTGPAKVVPLVPSASDIEGEMTGIFIGAGLSGDNQVANGLLQAYMRGHRTAAGVDLYKVNDPKVGLGLLQAEIEGDSSLSPEEKSAYLAYLGSAGGG